jgi:hypothetical protein
VAAVRERQHWSASSPAPSLSRTATSPKSSSDSGYVEPQSDRALGNRNDPGEL